MPLRLSVLLAVACVVAACAQAPATAPTPSAPPSTPAGAPPAVSPTSRAAIPTAAAKSPTATVPTAPTPAATPDEAPPEASELVDEAKAAVAQEVGVPVSQVTVVSTQMVEWADTSLGCPEPGMSYAQVITPGYLIRLEAGGRTFEYHTDWEGTVITCPNPQPPAMVAD